jgi:hypothetical protein
VPQPKRTAQRKRRSKVVLALGAAGLSLSLASSASAAIGGMNGAGSAPVSKQVYEEEISDTFHVFDREGRRARLAMGCGCGGCGCACGSDLYDHHSPHTTGARRPSQSAAASADPPGAQT